MLDTISRLYPPLIGVVLIGVILGRYLPPSVPLKIGQFLYYLGIPISIVAFLQQANLSSTVWIAPIVAWAGILLGGGIAWLSIRGRDWQGESKGCFLLASMVGNTGYIGYPVALAIGGETYFPWALFYDLLGTLLGSFGLGVVIASRYGARQSYPWWRELLQNPALWSLGLGLMLRWWSLPGVVILPLKTVGWGMVWFSLVLIGMRLSGVKSFSYLGRAWGSVLIKMTIVPLIFAILSSFMGLETMPRRILLLQMAMPPAFATVVLAEVYALDRELAVTALSLGSILLMFTLPLWLLL
ncbi:MAG: transporter [Cyanobacteria bacterium M5B4]|nr:MAG: transporter [Cyanobacteria bacterium M5B4]